MSSKAYYLTKPEAEADARETGPGVDVIHPTVNRVVCNVCAQRMGVFREYYEADFRVFGGCGRESACQICGEEHGGSVMDIRAGLLAPKGAIWIGDVECLP